MNMPNLEFNNNGGSVLPPNTVMRQGQYLQSPNKRYKLILQSDMNFVLYDNGVAVWVADNNPYVYVRSNANPMRGNGFFMEGPAFLNDLTRNRSWTTALDGLAEGGGEPGIVENNFLQLQDDGNIVVVKSVTLWSGTPSILHSPGTTAVIFEGEANIPVGIPFFSGDGALLFQGDGNLVNYGPNWSVRWASYTQNKGAIKAVFQADGNLVVYGANNVPLWNSGTGGHPGATMRLQPNGCLTIVQERPVWARFGFVPAKPPRRKVYYPDNSSAEHNGTDPYPTYGHIGWEF